VGAGLAPLMTATLMLLFSFGAALYFSWRFTLSVALLCPMLSFGSLTIFQPIRRDKESESAGVVAESVGNIKTVAAFCLQDRLVSRFTAVLVSFRGDELFARMMFGIGTALSNAGLFLLYGGTVMFGTYFVNEGVLAPGHAALSLFMLLSGVNGIADLARWVESATEGRAAARRIFKLIDRSPQIDAMGESGTKLAEVQGRIEFRDVHFWYPSRPDVQIFAGFSLSVSPNSTVALVGPSGSGKSSVVALLQRFYDPQRGSVTFDGHDLRDLNLGWLRSKMGLVQQEPALMSGTVLENICYGLGEVSEEAAIKAARLANAHAFIMQLPKHYYTSVGFGRNSRFSGGQKQRIAIARAIAADPAVLLLDEATSALDSVSERLVQDALDSLLVETQRTTIVIAHRLSTIRNADQICVMDKGQIIEQGRHEELLANPNGLYGRLVSRRAVAAPPPKTL